MESSDDSRQQGISHQILRHWCFYLKNSRESYARSQVLVYSPLNGLAAIIINIGDIRWMNIMQCSTCTFMYDIIIIVYPRAMTHIC